MEASKQASNDGKEGREENEGGKKEQRNEGREEERKEYVCSCMYFCKTEHVTVHVPPH